MFCANLIDLIVCLAVALIWYTLHGPALLIQDHHWQPSGVRLVTIAQMTGTGNANHTLSAVQFVFLASWQQEGNIACLL